MRSFYSNRFHHSMALLAMALGFGLTIESQATTYNVSKDATRAPYQTIQAAVNIAKNGDEIVILDNATYAEQVTIDSTKSGIVLRSSNPTALKKPTIVWNDKANVGPKSCQEALVDKNITFDQNGALRLLRTRNIIIEGIAVDGGGRSPFGYEGVWGNGVDCNGKLDPLFHGNAAIDLFVSGDITIRDCDISNAYFGINVKDRNEGGVFANPNPADLNKWRVVPLSGFGKTGNHVFERNRIHNNSEGMFFESAWDMSATIRYNLFYSNYHLAADEAAFLKIPGGDNYPGGCILFKDIVLSPVGIYNNTFWDNYTIFAGHWKPGAQHLIFNNIYGKPHDYLSAKQVNANPFTILDPAFANRTFSSLYAAQIEKPKLDSQKVQAQQYDTTLKAQVQVDSMVKFYRNVRIMNNMGNPVQSNFTVNLTLELTEGPKIVPQTIQGAILPGAIIDGVTADKAYPASALVRWLEVPFLSTDPTSPDFLTPNWDDSLVKKFVIDKGWPDAGLVDADGSPADIGAIPFGGIPTTDLFIKPLSPVIITGTTGTFTFNIQELAGDIQNPTITYFRWMNDIPIDVYGKTSSFGGNIPPLPATTKLTATGVVNVTGTTVTATVPSRTASQLYAFAEIIISGTDSKGNKVTTNVGFLPFRKLDYKFVVEVYDATGTTKLTTVKVGQAVKLVVTPQKSDGQAFTNTVIPVDVSLSSGANLVTPAAPTTKLTYPAGITNKTATDVMFNKVPAGGVEIIRVSGIWTSGGQDLAFLGTSTGIKITPGDPVKVVFQDPPSKITTPGSAPTVDPGQTYNVKLAVYDAFENKTAIPGTVTIKSNNPLIGDIVGEKTATSDSTGTVTFKAQVTNGEVGEIFELEASLTGGGSDKADLKVGKARDQLWVLYSDAPTGFNPAIELRGSAGDRLPITIRGSQDGLTKIAERTNAFTVQLSSGLTAYDAIGSTTPKTQFALVGGEVVIYVTSSRTISNGKITVTPIDDNTLLPGMRENIFFTASSFTIKSADYTANNGYGAVDKLDIYFGQDLTKAPDSLYLAWPTVGANPQVVKSGIAIDPADAKHVVVTLTTPFPAGLTLGGGALGSVFIMDPKAPDEPTQRLALNIADKVGPLIDSGKVYEKVAMVGQDTLLLNFSEPLSSATLLGATLQLVKAGQPPITLNVIGAQDLANGIRFKISVADLGPLAPVAGDSIRILPGGPITDALGNASHPLNRAIALGLKTVPRPPILEPDFDKPYETVNIPANLPDFLVLTPNGTSTWKPIVGGQGKTFGDCAAGVYCGPEIANQEGKIDRPAVNVITDRGFKYIVRIFSNTGVYMNSVEGEITNAQLGLDERGITNGTPTLFARTNGNFVVKIAWNAKAKDGRVGGTGAYIFRYTVIAKRELEDGSFTQEQRRQDVRFGIIRGQ